MYVTYWLDIIGYILLARFIGYLYLYVLLGALPETRPTPPPPQLHYICMYIYIYIHIVLLIRIRLFIDAQLQCY